MENFLSHYTLARLKLICTQTHIGLVSFYSYYLFYFIFTWIRQSLTLDLGLIFFSIHNLVKFSSLKYNQHVSGMKKHCFIEQRIQLYFRAKVLLYLLKHLFKESLNLLSKLTLTSKLINYSLSYRRFYVEFKSLYQLK